MINFSTGLIKESNDIEDIAIEENESILDTFYNLIIESNIDFMSIMNEAYNNDGTNPDIEECKATISTSLSQFGNAVSELLDRYKKIDNSNPEITSKSQFKNINIKDINYNKPFFNFKNLNMEKSFTSFNMLIEREIKFLAKDINRVNANTDDNNELAIIAQSNIMQLDNLDSELEKIRGSVLGLTYNVSKERFGEELFNYFRDATDEVGNEFVLTNSRLEIAVDEYFSRSTTINNMEKFANRFTSTVKSYLKEIDKINVSEDIKYPNVIKSICMNRAFRIKYICDIYKALFASKLNANDDYSKLNTDILLTVLKQSNSDSLTNMIESSEYYNLFFNNIDYTIEMYDSIISAQYNAVVNEADNAVVNKSISDSIKKYITKVNKSITDNWVSFNKKINNISNKKYLASCKDRVANFKKTDRVKDFLVYNIKYIDSLRLKQFDYDTNRVNYVSKSDYYKAVYPDLFKLNPKSIRKGLRAKCINPTDFVINRASVGNMYNYLVKDVYDIASKIESDIKVISNGTNTMSQRVSESTDLYELFVESVTRVLTEAPINGIKAPTSINKFNGIKVSKDNNTNPDNNPDVAPRKKYASYYKAVQIYMKVNCELLATEMNIVYAAYKDYFRAIRVLVK